MKPTKSRSSSGVYEGRTTGTPIALLIRNTDARSKDYDQIARAVPPGPCRLHLLAEVRHPRSARRRAQQRARNDDARRRGGDREEVAGAKRPACACADTWRRSATSCRARIDWDAVEANPFFWPDAAQVAGTREPTWMRCANPAIRSARASPSSPTACRRAGASRSTASSTRELAAAMMSINAVKGVEIGDGFAAVAQKGSEHRDEMHARRLPVQPRRRHPRRHQQRPADRRVDRVQADIEPAPAGARRGRATATRSKSSPPAATIPASASARRRSARRCWRWC